MFTEPGGASPWGDWPTAEACVRVPVTTVWVSPDAPRGCDTAITQPEPRVERWMSALGTSERLDLLGRVNTQALLGEPVQIITERNGWSEIRLPWQPTAQNKTGYPGWVPTSHLGPAPARTPNANLCCVSERLTLAKNNTARGEAIVLSIGTVLPLINPNTLRHPDGYDLEVSRQSLEPDGSPFATAQKFLGVNYLWSGISGWGVDCSGLVMISARTNGVVVPRDSTDQFDAAKSGTLNLPAPSLRWFVHPESHPKAGAIRHVAFALPTDETQKPHSNLMLHAPRTGFAVEVISQSEEPYATDAAEF
jgi:gamma-D-glutamyl-L-lysine dipeptidyl-peptidase